MLSRQHTLFGWFCDGLIWEMSCSCVLVTVVFTVAARRFAKYCLSLQLVTVYNFFSSIYWMWLSQTDKLIVPVGSVILASPIILVKCSVFTGSPSHLMQTEAVKFTELSCTLVQEYHVAWLYLEVG